LMPYQPGRALQQRFRWIHRHRAARRKTRFGLRHPIIAAQVGLGSTLPFLTALARVTLRGKTPQVMSSRVVHQCDQGIAPVLFNNLISAAK
jgi:hypothetical protein